MKTLSIRVGCQQVASNLKRTNTHTTPLLLLRATAMGNCLYSSTRTSTFDDDGSNSISELRQCHLPALNNQLEYLSRTIRLELLTKKNFVEVHEVHRLSKEAMEIQDRREELEAEIQDIVSEHAKNWNDFKIKQLPEEMLLEIFSFLFSVEKSAKYLI